MTLYLITDAVLGEVALVEASRAATAINAVVNDRFTASAISPREAFELGAKGIRLIDAETQNSTAEASVAHDAGAVEGDADLPPVAASPEVSAPEKTLLERMTEAMDAAKAAKVEHV